MSVELDNGFLLFGTNGQSRYYRGNRLTNLDDEAGESECNTLCSGDARKSCGGRNGLTLYKGPEMDAAVPSYNRG